MIRPITCLCLIAACGSGLYLYSEKHRTAMLDRNITQVIDQTRAVRASTGLLRAEWALLNEPGRLQAMSEKYLSLQPMTPGQFVQVASLAQRLPPPVAQSVANTGSTDEDAPPPAPQATVSPAPPVQHPMLTAGLTPPPAPKQAAKPDKPRTGLHHTAPASGQDQYAADHMLAHSSPLPLAAPQPMGAAVYSAMARPVPSRPPAHIEAAVASYVPPYAGSALGHGNALPPPVPYGR